MFSGSLRKLTSTDQSSALGYFPSIAELKSGANFFNYNPSLIKSGLSEVPKCRLIEEKSIEKPVKTAQNNYELPRMPPWFSYVGSLKLYQPLAGILRFVGLSLVAGDFQCNFFFSFFIALTVFVFNLDLLVLPCLSLLENISEGLLLHVIETLLGYFRKLVSELRLREYNKESWQSWYDRHGSGQLLRQASTAACMLNEIIFGVSDQSSNDFARIFHNCAFHTSFWKMPKDKGVKSYLVECIGGILHEYLSAEVWNVPIDCGTDLPLNAVVEEDISLYFFQDAAMLREERC